ncbi:(S)-2-(5-amino-1-(5-phospho-D-ribosyl)imidazole-4-carboxamido)succinate AMP-lyase [Aureococcus anophagefferens]|nr:(S)-2-(5-amino-1-(5-phospho-D-ribosyl)imidazole-4-carboxamido)succinate AMP-lyase [Aureococcus anophagefferens]
MAEEFELNALTPLDGRYASRVAPVRAYFSEAALIKYRVRVEVEYLVALSGAVPALADAIERTTNHDVKAVEYYLKERWDALGLPAVGKEFIHFGLTSQDVNHTAQPLMLAECAPWSRGSRLVALKARAWEWRDLSMLARTHGQSASPTRLGKEFAVFATRLEKSRRSRPATTARFGGATGGFNAHCVAFPGRDWPAFGDAFVSDVSGGLLRRQKHTTQIEHYDDLAAFCAFSRRHALCRCNTVVLDLCRDCWQYVSLAYFTQQLKAGEVGSSAMPHKVNPIDFENAEGNLGIASANLVHLAAKLPVSRLQRDLSDSTALRALGVPLGHACLALGSCLKGLGKLRVAEANLSADLEANWAVVAEGIQTVLRREAYPNPYEALKALTRTGKPASKDDIRAFVDALDVPDAVKAELRAITPHSSVGAFDASEFEPTA